jgi:hypothetical protein
MLIIVPYILGVILMARRMYRRGRAGGVDPWMSEVTPRTWVPAPQSYVIVLSYLIGLSWPPVVLFYAVTRSLAWCITTRQPPTEGEAAARVILAHLRAERIKERTEKAEAELAKVNAAITALKHRAPYV